ncbi:MAG: ankyrin repeat domain-containing protein [Gammaproteobacteria bacterium]|nr:ankyrin repeat domain-containing protein [Gammaproteobacteria bacterium]MCH9745069.1 ankyrin repeat domain-containing protein [Gammaproteobacteria bacterium]
MKQTDFMRTAKKPETNIAVIAKTYREHKATLDLDKGDGKDKSLLDYASYSGNTHLSIWLALVGTTINRQHKNNHKTPLHYATARGELSTALLLILFGADVSLEARTKSNRSVFSPPGYKTKTHIKTTTNIVIGFYNDLVNFFSYPGNRKLSEFKYIQEYGPTLLGEIFEINNITEKINLIAIFQLYPMLFWVYALIISDNTALKATQDVIVHEPASLEAIQTRRRPTYVNMPSLVLDDAKGVLFSSDKISLETKMKSVKDEIFLHQYIRLQSIFHLFVTYYRTRIDLVPRDIRNQDTHGNEESGTEACHSALLCELSEEFSWLPETVVSDETQPTKRNSRALRAPHFCNQHYLYNLLSGLTIELPIAVNQYDRKLEGFLTVSSFKPARREVYKLLQQVSLGSINPLQALEYFINSMLKPDGFLDEIRKAYLNKSTDLSPSPVRWIIHRYIFLATLQTVQKGMDGKLHLKRSQVASLLFMSKEDRANIKECDDAELQARCDPYFTTQQKEIITAKVR